MLERKAFCENCRDEIGYVVEDCQLLGTIRGVQYQYSGKEARCKECGELVYVPEINDANLASLYDAYRHNNGIISLEDIRSITEKYGIGKRPLSVLLGWGEQTLSRYIDGDIPTKQYSDILKRIAYDPRCYLQLLEENKDKLSSELTYHKSKKAVEELLNTSSAINGNLDKAIKYILYCCEDITHLALQKALYYIQGFYYAFFDAFIFSEDCEAWSHGPVYRKIYSEYANYHFDTIDAVEEYDTSILSAQEKAVFDSVIKNLCCYSGKVLERFTHNETPWLDARGELPESASSDRVIEKTQIAEYFCKVRDKYGMVTPSDIGAYSRAMFEKMY